MFAPLEAERKIDEKIMNWLSVEGNPGSGKMTNPENVLAEVTRVIMGEKGNLHQLAFRDPASFQAGEIHQHIPI